MPFRPFILLGLLVPVFSAGIAAGQHVTIDAVASDGGGTRYEVTFGWPSTIRAALDSANVSALEPRSVLALTGGLLEAAESVAMSRLGMPSVRIVESSFDEIVLEPATGSDSLVAALGEPLAEV